MDAINAALWSLLTSDAQLSALAPGGAWNLRADPKTPLSLIKFQLVIPTYDYTFGGLSSKRCVYKVTSHAEDTEVHAGAEFASVITGHLERVLDTDSLAVTGHEILICRPYAGVAPEVKSGASGRDEYSEGVLVEIIVAPTV